jgi:ASC-1-like (ASCH) protein
MISGPKSSDTEISRERLAFTIYHILREFDPEKKGYLTLTRFNKVAYLIHRDIEENLSINTGLPWYWYLYGSVVPLEYCPQSVYVKEELRDGEWRVFYRREPRITVLPVQEQKQILDRVKHWRDKRLGTDDAIDLAYQNVEIPFLREIKKFSDSIADPQSFKALIADKASVSRQLDRMLETYPEDKLNALLPIYLRFDNMLRALIADAKGSALAEHADLIEGFRRVILVNLRAHLCENMPEKWIADQSEESSRIKEHFEIEYDEEERRVFCRLPKKKDDMGYAKKLMEISWQSYMEG